MEFSILDNVNFEPWRGDLYESGIEGQKILILGESHYHDCENEPECRDELSQDTLKARHRELTRDVVGWWKDNAHRSPLSYRVAKLFELDKKPFWERVVFYNYLQTFAGPKARVRPNDDQWTDESNAKAFQSVLDEYSPDRFLEPVIKLAICLDAIAV